MLIPLDAATSPVLTVAEVKPHLKVQHSRDDALIEEFIAAAAEYIGQQTELVLQPMTIEQRLDAWPCGYRCVLLAAGPVRTVDGVSYLDVDGVEREVDAADYRWEATTHGAELWFVSGFSAPTLQTDRKGAVRIAFTAGFNDPTEADADARLALPNRVRQAVRMLVMHWYEHRGTIVVGDQPYPVPLAVETLIDSLRAYRS